NEHRYRAPRCQHDRHAARSTGRCGAENPEDGAGRKAERVASGQIGGSRHDHRRLNGDAGPRRPPHHRPRDHRPASYDDEYGRETVGAVREGDELESLKGGVVTLAKASPEKATRTIAEGTAGAKSAPYTNGRSTGINELRPRPSGNITSPNTLIAVA